MSLIQLYQQNLFAMIHMLTWLQVRPTTQEMCSCPIPVDSIMSSRSLMLPAEEMYILTLRFISSIKRVLAAERHLPRLIMEVIIQASVSIQSDSVDSLTIIWILPVAAIPNRLRRAPTGQSVPLPSPFSA